MILNVGSKGDDVLSLQKNLNLANAGVEGYVPLVEDGIYGSNTQKYVTNYQTANGLTVDGIAGPQTLTSLSDYLAKNNPATTPTTPANTSATTSATTTTSKPSSTTNNNIATVTAPTSNSTNNINSTNTIGSTTAPTNVTPTNTNPATTTDPNTKLGLRDYAESLGLLVDWSSDTGPTINGIPIDISKLSLGSDNRYYGTKEQLDDILSKFVYQNPYAEQEQEAYDDYNQWLQTPYASQYAPQIEQLVNQILTRTFNYDPANDAQFQKASKELTRSVLETMNERGILNSTITENQVQQGISDLLPTYQQLAKNAFDQEGNSLMAKVDMLMGLDNTAYGRYQDEGTKLANALNMVMQMDDRAYSRWQDAYTNRYNAYQQKLEAESIKIQQEQARIEDAWDRVDQLGYADNESALILGIEPGTLSKSAREAYIKRQQELEDKAIDFENDMAKIEAQYQNSVKLTNLRNSLSEKKESDKTSLGTEEQYQYYNNAFNYLLDMNNGDGNAAYQQLMREQGDYRDSMGEKLFTQLGKDLLSYQKASPKQTLTVDDYVSAINKQFITYDADQQKQFIDYDGIGQYITDLDAMGVDQSIIDDLCTIYHLAPIEVDEE